MAQVKASAGERGVIQTVRGHPTSDGAGVRLNRVIGTPALPRLDPFLMLDEFRSDDANDTIAGFPNHPHRSFETVTYFRLDVYSTTAKNERRGHDQPREAPCDEG